MIGKLPALAFPAAITAATIAFTQEARNLGGFGVPRALNNWRKVDADTPSIEGEKGVGS
ncbi:MAG TPA: hypothetical protein VFH21_07705 [Burkholderiales bacterium]|nr:hypothetical protein [Burkholderiales bacterium]